MHDNQESLFQARFIIELAADDLAGSVELGIPMWDSEIVGICERLRVAGQIIRTPTVEMDRHQNGR